MSSTHQEIRNPDRAATKMIWIIGTGFTFAVLPQVSDAAVVQITLVDNFISESVDRLDYDLTGSGVDPGRVQVGGQDFHGHRPTEPDRARVSLGPSPFGPSSDCPFTWPLWCSPLAIADQSSTSAYVSVIRTTNGGYVGEIAGDSGILGASVSTLTEFSFRDARFGEDRINGWLQIDASTSYSSQDGPQAQIALRRVLWDDENLLIRPEGLLASDSAYPEARPIPEPSSLALLALGAAGGLARRRR